jgi:predicted metal-binding protein
VCAQLGRPAVPNHRGIQRNLVSQYRGALLLCPEIDGAVISTVHSAEAGALKVARLAIMNREGNGLGLAQLFVCACLIVPKSCEGRSYFCLSYRLSSRARDT